MNDERVDHGTCAIGDEIVAVFGGTTTEFGNEIDLVSVEALQIQTC